MKKIIGQFGVDSGTIMIVDPCYFNDPLRWDIENLLKIAKEQRSKGEIKFAENTERLAKEKRELQNIVGNWKQVCEDSHDKEDKLPMNYASGVMMRTLHGDGLYDVVGHFNKAGKMTKIEVVF